MADIISIVSGVLTFVAAVQTAITASNDFRSATKEQTNIIYHLSKAKDGLEKLQRVLEKTDPEDEELKDIGRHLEEFEQMIEGLRDRMKPSETASRFQFRERFSWVFGGKSQAQEDTAKIGTFEKLIDQWLSSDMWEKMRKLDKNANDEERRKILDWISPLNPFARQDQILSAREPGTGNWLLENSEFQKWKSGDEKPLWCSGIPGAGKTVQASIVVDHLRNEPTENFGLAVVYCNYEEREIQTSVNLLSSILKQLYDRISLSEKLKDLYNQHKRRDTRPTFAEISELLRAEIDRFSKVFIIVDAVDECTEENQCRQSLLNQLYALQPKARLMFTSRPDVSTPTECTRLEIMASKADLERYIDGQLRGASRLSRLQDEWERIKKTVSNKADGMFLLARIHMNALATTTSRPELSQILGNLADNLDTAYANTLKRIESQPDPNRRLAWRVLGWVSHALRPLSVTELQEALTIKLGDTAIDKGDLPDAEDLTSVCAGLVVLDRSSNAFRLVHYTAQQYLERLRDNRFTDTQSEIAGICLTRLSFTGLECYDPKASLQNHSLLDYACQYGMVHARGAPESHLKATISKSLGQKPIRRKIQQMIRSHDPSQFPSEKNILSPMHLAVYFGLAETVSGMHLEAKDVHSNGSYGTAITIASWRGFEGIVRLMMEKDADVNAQGGHFGNALQAASKGGYEQIVELLLDKGAKVNAKGGYYGTALQAASSEGNERIVRILLHAGAKVNAKGGEFGNALYAASRQGHESIVHLLLDAGAKVNAQGGHFENPLQVASKGGYEPIVRLLLAAGAEVNAQGGAYGNALHGAANRGREKIARLLLDKGAEVNVQGGYFGNPLQAASNGGNEEIVKLLLDAGAEVNAQGGWYGNALQAASKGGHEQIIRILLGAGAEVNAQGGDYGNALLAASKEGHEYIVRILLDAGPKLMRSMDTHPRRLHTKETCKLSEFRLSQALNSIRKLENGETHFMRLRGKDTSKSSEFCSMQALMLTCMEDAMETLYRRLRSKGMNKSSKLCSNAGAVVDAQGGQYGNALQAASNGGNDQVVQLLLDAGADVNAQGGIYGSALQAALDGEYEQIVRLLLDAGAVNEQGGNRGNALQETSNRGCEHVARLLLESGAEVPGQ